MKKLLLTGLFISVVAALGITQQIVVTCVFDGPLSGGLPKGVELYAIDDIPDLSMLGIGGANNGGGSDSVEYSFPSMTVTAGTYLYVSSDSAGFANFFGFNADFVTEGMPNAMAINGNDAIELFWNGTVVDVFGDINVDGTGTAWEYLDGWVARKPLTGPDGSTFLIQNWNFSGPNALDGETTNATAAFPVPLQTYTDTTGGGDPDVIVILQNVTFTPRDITIELGQTVRFTNVETYIEHNVNGGLDTYPCNPFGFFRGMETVGPWDFDVLFTKPGFYDYQCDPHIDYDMVGTVTVVDPNAPDYPVYDIDLVGTEDANGVADSLGTLCTLKGIVYGGNLRPPGYLITIIDDNGNGIAVFKDGTDCYDVQEGDEITLRGSISQFNGLTQIEPVINVEIVSTGNALLQPVLVEAPLSEATESKFIQVEGIRVDSVVGTGSSGWNVYGSNSNGAYLIRLDSDLFDNADGLDGQTISVTGIGSQFDSEEPLTDGYQLVPRWIEDIEIVLSAQFLPDYVIALRPNPVSNILYFDTDLQMNRIQVYDLTGKLIVSVSGNDGFVNLSRQLPGLYVVQVLTEDGIWTSRIVKE